MTARVLFAALVVAGLTAFAPAPFPKPDNRKDDLKSLAGSWSVYRYEMGGNPVLSGATLQVKVDGEKWSFFRVTAMGTTPSTAYTIALDPKKDPRLIDFKMVGGAGELKGIYRFDKGNRNQLQVVFNTFGVMRRPTGFDGTDRGAYTLMMKRDKP